MKRTAHIILTSLFVLGLVLGALPKPTQTALALSPDVVISQVYGGGGNSGAIYSHDFIELFNRGAAPVSLAGWSLQYASATGTGAFGSSATQLSELPDVTLQPGQYYLVQEAMGTTIVAPPLPTPDLIDPTPIAMSGTGGKVALATTNVSLGCNGGSIPCSPEQLALIKDLVGWDGANFYETAPAPATTNSTAILRNNGGCAETDNNAADFSVGTPTPRNTASPFGSCVLPTDPSGVGAADPNPVTAGDSTLLTVLVTPGSNPTSTGLAVTGDLTAIGGAAAQPFFDDGSSGDLVPADNIFTFLADIPAAATPGAVSLAVSISDAEGRTGSAAIDLTVLAAVPTGGDIVISQVYGGGGNTGATLTNDFIELYNRSAAAIDITGWSVQYASSTGTTWQVTALSGIVQPGQYYLIQEAAGAGGTTPLPAADAVGSIAMSATSGKVALVNSGSALSGSCPTGLPDFVGYGLANCFEGTGAAPTLSNTTAALRAGDGAVDTDNNNADFSAGVPNPRNSSFGFEAAPFVDSVNPADGTTGVLVDANLSLGFSEDVSLNADWYSLSCSVSGAHTGTVSGGPMVFTIDPDIDFAYEESCTLTVFAVGVSDLDTDDPPDNMEADFSASFTTQAYDVCSVSYTPAYAIQGSGASAAITGIVTTQGVVVGDYELPSGSNMIRGFYLQDLNGDGDELTSDGIFVYTNGVDRVSLGQVVRVTGTAAEFQGQTQISSVSAIVNCGMGAVAPATVTMPFPSLDYLERYEGMLVTFPQTLYVTEHFQLGRFGQVTLSSGARLQQPTNVVLPGAPALALQAENNLNRIILDDDTNAQNPDPIIYARGGLPLSASNTLRGGDTVENLIGVLVYGWAGNSASPNAYRVRAAGDQDPALPNFLPANPRPSAAPALTGSLRVAGMNVLNYFNTWDGLPDSVDNCTLGVGGLPTDCRGADTLEEFERQWVKTVAAILATHADVIGLTEIENDGYGADSAIQMLVDQLNAASAPGTFAFIDADAATGQVNALGTDAIKVAFIYKPASVTPLGTAALNTDAFVYAGDLYPRNRPALAQTFEQPNGARFTAVVNHLKSKGSACDDPDALDGQGACNIVRTIAATELANWLAADPTGSGDADILIIGDLNSYAMEDPIMALQTAGYTNMILALQGMDAYSYVFDGQWGYLDHALSSANLVGQISATADYHINADEPSVLDYNTNFKSAAQIVYLYAPDEFRMSDHDAVLVDLNLNAPPSVDAGGPYMVDEGSSVMLNATGFDPNGDLLTYEWDLDGDSIFETPGQSVSFLGVDGPAMAVVSVRVSDPGGLSEISSALVTINNVAPSLGAISAPTDPAAINTLVSASASFSDPGVLDTHSAVWDWGDGSTSAGVVTETNGSGAVDGSHAYTVTGVYTINLTVTDKDGGSTTAIYQYVVVYDPYGGYVNGIGTLDGQTGWCQLNPTCADAAGPVNFAFVVRYLSGGSVPTGKLELNFPSGGLLLRSVGFQWLVINPTATTAWFSGTGTINGQLAPNGTLYLFTVTATDLGLKGIGDAFKIRVWYMDSGEQVVVFSTGSDQPIGDGGNIKIHKP